MALVEHNYVTVGPQLHTLLRIVHTKTFLSGGSLDTVSSRSREPIGECPPEGMGEGLPRHFSAPPKGWGSQTGEAQPTTTFVLEPRYDITQKGRDYLRLAGLTDR